MNYKSKFRDADYSAVSHYDIGRLLMRFARITADNRESRAPDPKMLPETLRR